MKCRKNPKPAAVREYIKNGYIVQFYYRDHSLKLGEDFVIESIHRHEETRYVGLVTNQDIGTCSGEGEAVAGFSKDFRKQLEDAEGFDILLYKDLPEDVKKFFNKEILRGDKNEEYNKRRTGPI